jgi:mannose-1-phosphate guanylyltransferase
MQALILAGGKGTRLRPLTVYTPKPIVPVLNRPFLTYQLESLRRAGITEIVLSLNYQPDKIESILGDGSEFGVNLRYVTEPIPLGTAGAYKYAAREIRETTVVFNGDILTDLDVSLVVEQHLKRKADATIVLTRVENPSAYGLVETDSEGNVLAFREKPTAEELREININTINAGVYILEPSVLEMIEENENCSFEYKVFPELLATGKRFSAYIMEEQYWRDIGNPESYLKAHHDLLSGTICDIGVKIHPTSEIATTAIVDSSSILGENCVIKPNAKIINSVIGKGVLIEEKTVIENSVIWTHTKIAGSSHVENAVIGKSCYVGKNCTIRNGSVLGDKTSVTDYSKI